VHRKDTLLSRDSIMNQEDRFLEGVENFDYEKSEQIEQTQTYFISKVINDLDSQHKKYFRIKRNLQNYKKINDLTTDEIRGSDKNFKEYIIRLIKD
jgi:hypothetical protein